MAQALRHGRRLYRKRPTFRNHLGHAVPERLYLDHAATTPVSAIARAAMAEALENWANPSSPHAEGRAAKAALESARVRIGKALDWPHDIIFTSGASEAIALALTRNRADALFVSAVEHDAVTRCVPKAFTLPVTSKGEVTADVLAQQLDAHPVPLPLVAVQHANNETGVIQPLEALIPLVRARGGLIFVDCAQTAAKLPLPDADMIAISAHKFGGPPGIGALLVKDLGQLSPSGGQEKGYRGGTENLPAILSMTAAAEAGRGWLSRAADLREHLDAAIEAAGGQIVASNAPRLSTIGSYHMPGKPSSAQLIQFDLAGISVSAGSACSSGTLKTSHVLKAMGMGEEEASEVIRVSFGPETSRADIYRFVDTWQRIRG